MINAAVANNHTQFPVNGKGEEETINILGIGNFLSQKRREIQFSLFDERDHPNRLFAQVDVGPVSKEKVSQIIPDSRVVIKGGGLKTLLQFITEGPAGH